MLKQRTRFFFALVILITSLAMLAWSFLPGARIVRRQKIEPTEMQLPLPGSFLPLRGPAAWMDFSKQAAYVGRDADCFAWLN